MSKNRIQALLISYLNKHGRIELLLPDGVVVEIGVDQENARGECVKKEGYCWVVASRQDKAASIDSYNLGLRFNDEATTIVFDDRYIDHNGDAIRRLEIV